MQTNHIHLIVEAGGSRALARGVQGMAVRCARAINRACRRAGAVWSHRFHARALRTPQEVRRALAYVLLNFCKHLGAAPGIDPCSSGPWFEFWARPPPWRPPDPSPLPPPRTWLAAVGWRRAGGAIAFFEAPRRR